MINFFHIDPLFQNYDNYDPYNTNTNWGGNNRQPPETPDTSQGGGGGVQVIDGPEGTAGGGINNNGGGTELTGHGLRYFTFSLLLDRDHTQLL